MSSSTACFDTFNLTIVGLFELEVYIFVWFKISLWFTVNKISCNKVCCTDMISTCHTHNKKNIKAERSLQPFYKQSLSWILVKCVTFVEDVVMLEEWKCNPSTSTANGLQGLKFMLLLEEEEALREEEVILFISPVAAHPTRQLFPLIGTVWHFGKYTYSLVVKIVCENYQT